MNVIQVSVIQMQNAPTLLEASTVNVKKVLWLTSKALAYGEAYIQSVYIQKYSLCPLQILETFPKFPLFWVIMK